MFAKPTNASTKRKSQFYIDPDKIEGPETHEAMIYVRAAELTAVKERFNNANKKKPKQYAFVLDLEWSDGSSTIIWRSYSEFFEFQCRLLNAFPEEAGSTTGSVRCIPFLPGQSQHVCQRMAYLLIAILFTTNSSVNLITVIL